MDLLPAIQGYTIGGKSLAEITATALPTNTASGAILTKLGMTKTHVKSAHGALLDHYAIKLYDKAEVMRDPIRAYDFLRML